MFHDGFYDGYQAGKRHLLDASESVPVLPSIFNTLKYGPSYAESFARGVEQALRDAGQSSREQTPLANTVPAS
jgi:hypothetical protein